MRPATKVHGPYPRCPVGQVGADEPEALLRLASRLAIEVHTTTYSFEEVDRALEDLQGGRVSGSLVVTE